jgi:hypothetical protein
MPKDMMWGPDEVFLQSDNLNVTTKNFAEVTNQGPAIIYVTQI